MSDRTPATRIPELDGLRGMAILMVWVGHYFAVPAEGQAWFLDGYWIRLGWTGVDLFFVLSGFLIGGILLEVRDSPRYFKTFYARRFFRIVPLYYAWILAYVLLATFAGRFLIAHFGAYERVDRTILAHFLFLQNSGVALTSTVSFLWLTATWSLAVEEQFYLLAPILVRRLTRRALTIFLIVVTVAAPFLRVLVRRRFDSSGWLSYQLMPCRADLLAIGMLTALLWGNATARHWMKSHILIMHALFATLLAGFAWMWRWSSDPVLPQMQKYGYTWIALLFAVALLLAISYPRAPVAAIARLAFLRDLGGVSYCIYIIHAAVFLFCHQLMLHQLPVVTDVRVAEVTLLAALITYSIAKLSWKILEQPMQRRGHTFKY